MPKPNTNNDITEITVRTIIGDKYNTHVYLIFTTPDQGQIIFTGVNYENKDYNRLIELVKRQNPTHIDLKATASQLYITYYGAFDYQFEFRNLGSDLEQFIKKKFTIDRIFPPPGGNKPSLEDELLL